MTELLDEDIKGGEERAWGTGSARSRLPDESQHAEDPTGQSRGDHRLFGSLV
jgi:hypothetical protein